MDNFWMSEFLLTEFPLSNNHRDYFNIIFNRHYRRYNILKFFIRFPSVETPLFRVDGTTETLEHIINKTFQTKT